MVRFPRLLAALALACSPLPFLAPAHAQVASKTLYIGPNAIPDRSDDGVLVNGVPTKLSDAIARAGGSSLAPVCSGGWFPGEGSTSTSSTVLQTGGRKMLWCPPRTGGLKSIRLQFNNTLANTVETDTSTTLPINIGVEASPAPPWSGTTAYAVGAAVVYGTSQYTAAVANTGVAPGPATTATWTASALQVPSPATCNGTRGCQIATVTTAAGATVLQGVITTDPIAVNVPAAGGWIAVDLWTNQAAGANLLGLGAMADVQKAEYFAFGAAVGDRSITGTLPGSPLSIQYTFGPLAVVAPSTTPSVCTAGDSISAGVMGQGVISVGALTGGTGFVATDVGLLGTISNTGASAGAVNASARFRIGAVSGGAITTLQLIDNGSYTNPASQTSQTLPSGAQTLIFPGAAGTGASVASVTLSSAHDIQGAFGGQGWIQRALNGAGIPWVAFSRSADTLANWISRDYSRLAAIAATGCTTIVNELGVNDMAGGAPAAIANARALVAQERGLPGVKRILWTTLTPQTAVSTDGFLTSGNQAINTGLTASIATFNAAVRSLALGNDDFIEASDVASTARDSGVWKSDGATVGLLTADGLHPSQTGHAIIAAGTQAQFTAKVQ